MNLKQVLSEFRQRHVYRVAVIYAAAVWVLLQVADVVLESFDSSDWWMRGLIVASLLGFPLVLLASWFFGPDSAAQNSSAAKEASKVRPSTSPGLIVLPFDCISERSADRWYADALTEDLTSLISRLPGFSVIARRTAFTYKGQSVDVGELGAKLGVRYALEGSVRHSSRRLRVTAQLVETESGTQLWAEQYDRNVGELEELHDETCRSIVFKLGAELTRAEIDLCRGIPPAQWGAWELYQQAKGALQFAGWSEESFERTAGLLREAIAIDPDYAPAHAYLSLILALGHWIRLYPDEESVYEAALAAADRALALSPDSSEVLGYVGCALSDLGHPERGVPVIERAIELNPSNSQAVAALGAAKVVSGKLAEGIEDLKYAIQISPADPGLAPWSTMLSVAENYSGNVSAALEWAGRARKADPHYFGAYVALSLAYFYLDRIEDAKQALAEACHLNPDLSVESVIVFIGHGAWRAMQQAGIGLSGA